jgi:hypothetical protein
MSTTKSKIAAVELKLDRSLSIEIELDRCEPSYARHTT